MATKHKSKSARQSKRLKFYKIGLAILIVAAISAIFLADFAKRISPASISGAETIWRVHEPQICSFAYPQLNFDASSMSCTAALGGGTVCALDITFINMDTGINCPDSTFDLDFSCPTDVDCSWNINNRRASRQSVTLSPNVGSRQFTAYFFRMSSGIGVVSIRADRSSFGSFGAFSRGSSSLSVNFALQGQVAGQTTEDAPMTTEDAPIILYDDYHLGRGGGFIGFSDNVPDLRNYGWNDRASSLKIKPGYQAVIYEDINYEGAGALVVTEDDYSWDDPRSVGYTPNTEEYGLANRAPGRYRYYIYDLSKLTIGNKNFGNMISSLRVWKAFDFSLSVNPSSGTLEAGKVGYVQVPVTVALTPDSTAVESVALSCEVSEYARSNGISCSWVGVGGLTCTPFAGAPCTRQLTIATSSSTPSSDAPYTITIKGVGFGITHSVDYKLTISPAFDFELSASPNQNSVAEGQAQSKSTLITATKTSGTMQPVALSCWPPSSTSSITCHVPDASCTDNSCSSTATINIPGDTAIGTYTVGIMGVSGMKQHSAGYTLTVETQRNELVINKEGSGSGEVTSTPTPSVSCSTTTTPTCSQSYSSPTNVELTPSAASGSKFTGWTGCDSSSGDICSVLVSSAKTVTATFKQTRTLSISKGASRGTGTVTLSAANSVNRNILTCGANCNGDVKWYLDGATATLTATPAAGSTFTGWGSRRGTTINCPGTGNCVVIMDAPKEITATFNKVAPATGKIGATVQKKTDATKIGGATVSAVNAAGQQAGSCTTASSNAGGAVKGSCIISNLPAGTYSVTVSASGYTAQTLTVTVRANVQTAKTFKMVAAPAAPPSNQYKLEIAPIPASGGYIALPDGTLFPAGSYWYNIGTSIQLSAVAGPGDSFYGWLKSVGGSDTVSLGSANPITITVDEPDILIFAMFQPF